MTDNRPEDAVLPGAGEDEGFLTRWSQRKAEARKGVELPEPGAKPAVQPAADTVADTQDATAPEPVERSADLPDSPEDTTPELPPIESLDENSDYSAFLSSDVSADVQRKALRKLFQSPKFNVRDGLDDYDLDFTNPEPLGDIITAEMRHRMRVELEKLAGLDEDAEDVEDTETVAAVAGEAEQHDEPAGDIDPEPDDEHTEPS
jgi:hypothetical protein